MMKKDDMNRSSKEYKDELPPRSSKYKSTKKKKSKWKPLLIVISILLSISIVIFFQGNNITTTWQSSLDSVQGLLQERTATNENKATPPIADQIDEEPSVGNNENPEEGTQEADQQNDNHTESIKRDATNHTKNEIRLNFEAYHLTEKLNPQLLLAIKDTDSSFQDQVINFLNADAVLQGVDVKREFYYEVPISKVGNNNYLQLVISHSSLLDPKQSTLTVMVDDVPIKSVFLTKKNENRANIRIPLQEEFLHSGFHKITLNSHSVITDDLCLDDQNPANWVEIHATSFAYLDSKELWARDDLLKDFPYPFVQTGTPLETHGYIVIPDHPSEPILSAALTLSSYLSSFTVQQTGYPIITESTWMAKKDFKHIIAIGSLPSWKGFMTNIIDENSIQAHAKELTLDNFILKNEKFKQLLLVSGPNDEVINEKISVLSNTSLEQQLTGNTLRVTNIPEMTVVDNNETTLATIGFEDILLDGHVSRSGTQFFTIPPYGEIQDGSYLDLMIKVSPSIIRGDFNEKETSEEDINLNRNTFTVNINSIPYGISLHQLRETLDDSGFYHFQLPLSEQLLEENRMLEVNFSSNLNNEQYGCIEDPNNQWIFVDNNSTFHINYDDIKEANNFKYWPAPYIHNGNVQNVAILIPEQVDQPLLSQLSNLYSHMLSQSINQKRFTIIRGEPGKKEQNMLENAHVIIMGPLMSYPFLQDKINQSVVEWKDNQIDLTNYSILNETTDYVAWIEPSFWNQNKMMTVLFNLTREDTYLHQDLLDYLFNQSEEVNLIVRNKSGDIFTDNMQQKETRPEAHTEDDPTDPNTIPIAPLISFFIILFIGIVIFMIFLKKSKR